jgi:hypothetical protein
VLFIRLQGRDRERKKGNTKRDKEKKQIGGRRRAFTGARGSAAKSVPKKGRGESMAIA